MPAVTARICGATELPMVMAAGDGGLRELVQGYSAHHVVMQMIHYRCEDLGDGSAKVRSHNEDSVDSLP